MYEVYEEGVNLPDDHRTIASFWDCNPFAMQNTGHLMVALKKISPGAHWMGITGIACREAEKDFSEAMTLAYGGGDRTDGCISFVLGRKVPQQPHSARDSDSQVH